ncbi:undecaprenyldiphospho-muramoylpentapeptide beta-N-acetylglucosaminyltransferase [Bauldia sp.]|uniref:undecaprenyldiphospho-muramoylpentapeptide beta-N-acetylglucosaminyltransferase n=1 Tax=Bauldia sp. TaxID=2575872 RepID=UPI003BACB228
MTQLVLISAGGTGGHLFPAEALARALTARGWTVHLASDHRVDALSADFPAEAIHIIPSATPGKNPLTALRAAFRLARGYLAARRIVARTRPHVAIGFGGYPTVPPMLAAARAGVPAIVHDQNAVIGRANRFLAPHMTAIATAVDVVVGAEPFRQRTVKTGNPVRAAVRKAAETPYPERTDDKPFRLLAFGGSQGARFLSDLVPAAVAELDADHRRRLTIVQQCRPEDLDRVAEAYRTLGVEAELKTFFDDMPARIAWSHLVVSRSGASTVAELAVIGRPAMMVPLPHALDQDQKANATILATAGGGWMVEQSDMTPTVLAEHLTKGITDPGRLQAAAQAAGGIGQPDAVENLADLVERVAKDKRVERTPA